MIFTPQTLMKIILKKKHDHRIKFTNSITYIYAILQNILHIQWDVLSFSGEPAEEVDVGTGDGARAANPGAQEQVSDGKWWLVFRVDLYETKYMIKCTTTLIKIFWIQLLPYHTKYICITFMQVIFLI